MSKTERQERPEILIDVYGKNSPAAATFGTGARTLEDVEAATEARDALVEQQTRAADLGLPVGKA